MGTVNSIDSCSAGTGEAKKDSLFGIPSVEDLAKYNDLEQRLTESPQPQAVTGSTQRSLSVTTTKERPLKVTRSSVMSGIYGAHHEASSSKSPAPSSSGRHHNGGVTAAASSSRGISRLASHRPSLKGVRRAGSKVLGSMSHAASAVGHSSKRLLFIHPSPSPKQRNRSRPSKPPPPPTSQVSCKVRGGVLLRGCWTDDEHRQRAREVVETLRALHGQEGLAACGFEYRLVNLNGDGQAVAPSRSSMDALSTEDQSDVPDLMGEPGDGDGSVVETSHQDGIAPVGDEGSHCDCDNDLNDRSGKNACKCDSKRPARTMTRLFHIESDTMITETNRKEFIADGDMYDAVARVAMQYAQDVMIREGELEWVTIAEAGNNPEPIRALVSRRIVEDETRLDTEPTLLIATGKGKVRAGVFSRQHLLLSGLECATAVPIVEGARIRKMNVIMVDPNVHGERFGMITFEKSMAHLFRRWEESDDGLAKPNRPPLSRRDLYVLSHSQSGAQFARYMLDKSEFYVPHIRAVAFTDSTHNVQWAKKKEELRHLLESESCIYFKCANDSNSDGLKPLATVGEVVDTDEFWIHRFGAIKTLCAGTSEHSLTNWFARCLIWDHFDQYLWSPVLPSNNSPDNNPDSDNVEVSGRAG